MSSYQNQLLAAGIGGQQPAGYADALNPLGAFIGNVPSMFNQNESNQPSPNEGIGNNSQDEADDAESQKESSHQEKKNMKTDNSKRREKEENKEMDNENMGDMNENGQM